MTMFHFLHKKDGFPANETVPKEAAPEIPMPPLSIMIWVFKVVEGLVS